MDNDEINSSNHLSSIDDVSTLKQDGNAELSIEVLQTEDELSQCYVLGYN